MATPFIQLCAKCTNTLFEGLQSELYRPNVYYNSFNAFILYLNIHICCIHEKRIKIYSISKMQMQYNSSH